MNFVTALLLSKQPQTGKLDLHFLGSKKARAFFNPLELYSSRTLLSSFFFSCGQGYFIPGNGAPNRTAPVITWRCSGLLRWSDRSRHL